MIDGMIDQVVTDHINARQQLINDALPPGVIFTQAAVAERIRALVNPRDQWTTYTLDGQPFLLMGPSRLEHEVLPDEVKWKLVCEFKPLPYSPKPI